MRIKKNDQLPTFNALDIFNNSISSSNFEGKRVYISFLRTASCPFCNLRVHELIQKQAEWNKKGIITIAVFASPSEEILEYAGKQKPPFTIISDPNEVLYKKFGITHSYWSMLKTMTRLSGILETIRKGFFNFKSFTDKPILTGDFLIDENKNVIECYYGKDFGDHISFEKIDEWKS